jgi:hypothetical protein
MIDIPITHSGVEMFCRVTDLVKNSQGYVSHAGFEYKVDGKIKIFNGRMSIKDFMYVPSVNQRFNISLGIRNNTTGEWSVAMRNRLSIMLKRNTLEKINIPTTSKNSLLSVGDRLDVKIELLRENV